MTSPAEDRRSERRAFIVAHHPDRGGDPEEFARGLARFDRVEPHPPDAAPPARSGTPPTVVRSRNPARAVRRTLRRWAIARRRRTHHGIVP